MAASTRGGIVMPWVCESGAREAGAPGRACRRALTLGFLAGSLGGAAWAQSAVLGSGEFVFDTRWAEESFASVSAGFTQSGAIRADGSLVCWGLNGVGECIVPALPPGRSFASVAMGVGHVIATLDDGSPRAWGSNAAGQCDIPPVPQGVTYVQFAAGNNFS